MKPQRWRCNYERYYLRCKNAAEEMLNETLPKDCGIVKNWLFSWGSNTETDNEHWLECKNAFQTSNEHGLYDELVHFTISFAEKQPLKAFALVFDPDDEERADTYQIRNYLECLIHESLLELETLAGLCEFCADNIQRQRDIIDTFK